MNPDITRGMQIFETVDRASWVHASDLEHRGKLLAVAIHPRDMTRLYMYAHSKIELHGLLTKRVPADWARRVEVPSCTADAALPEVRRAQ